MTVRALGQGLRRPIRWLAIQYPHRRLHRPRAQSQRDSLCLLPRPLLPVSSIHPLAWYADIHLCDLALMGWYLQTLEFGRDPLHYAGQFTTCWTSGTHVIRLPMQELCWFPELDVALGKPAGVDHIELDMFDVKRRVYANLYDLARPQAQPAGRW